ncbi:transcriptional repressor [Sphingomonas sp. R-74633]|uniref:Fur family transcriptional regulator n=1 Tax=Sphingomonas sp. R-74633 TaxID=2751188 RepID=UPI0015D157E4|nr:transcriptional repressor [Sphingomonas sp. R-74633]NYT42552.1 transcriptional repressor [Sphingomonas sp. R-74633]
MAGIAMAEGKRNSGFLHDRVLRLLKAQHPHPLTGLQLAELLQAEGDVVPVSQVYRALRRLIDEGAIRKILVAGGYAPVWRESVVLLWCRVCGEVREVPCPEVFQRLEAIAGGLKAPHCLIEVPGVCAACAEVP